MTFLPIVDRELRVRARLPGTWRVRLLGATLALVISGGMAWQARRAGMVGVPAGWGFATITMLAFLFCLWEGLRGTADCLSEEKREGTLGLLFLTDLRGYDIILGKLTATSLNSFYGLLAIFPMMAIPLLVGGVTVGEFARVALVLMNTLFFSLAAGMWMSARHLEQSRAMTWTGFVIALGAGGGIIADTVLALGNFNSARAVFAVASPGYTCLMAFDSFYTPAPARYWLSLALTHGLGWLMLALAVWTLPRHWQGDTARLAPAARVTTGARTAERAALLDLNPILWLATRRRVPAVWVVLVAGLALRLFPAAMSNSALNALSIGFSISCSFALYFLFAWIVCGSFAEARRSGALELLLSTPLPPEEMVRGQILAARRQLWKPVLSVLIYSLVANCMWMWRSTGLSGGLLATLTFVTVLDLAGIVTQVWAITWVGMWLALSARKPGQAAAWTFVGVALLPSLMVWMLQWFPIVIGMNQFMWVLLKIVIDVLFVRWAKRGLREDFRGAAARAGGPVEPEAPGDFKGTFRKWWWGEPAGSADSTEPEPGA